MTPRRGDLIRAFLRTFAIQGSWNYGSFQAGGLVYALIPLLRRIHAGDPVELRRSLQRHLQYFNGHPYLGPLAVGALARAEEEGMSGDDMDRLRRALSSATGAVGDRLVWASWRPFCLLCSILLYALGAGPWTSVAVFLLGYNAGHLTLRVWAFHTGWEKGLDAAAALGARTLAQGVRYLAAANQFLLGGVAVTLAFAIPQLSDVATLGACGAALAAVTGLRWPGATGRVVGGVLLFLPLVRLLAG